MTALLEVDEVVKSFDRGMRTQKVLDGVSLEVRPGDFVAVFGSRSGGKSTLLKIAVGLERPDSGAVRFLGTDLTTVSPNRLADIRNRELAFVTRSGPQSEEFRMASYVALPVMYKRRPAEAERLALDALDRVGALDCAPMLWEALGHHERTLVSLAHAIVRRPKLLVLDDPTAGLDAVERNKAMALLRELAAEMDFGALMAVPDMPSMLRSSGMYALSHGRLYRAGDDPTDGNGGTVVELPRVERSA